MEQILDLPVEADRKREYADFGTRLVAAIIDGILLFLARLILGWIIAAADGGGAFVIYFLGIILNAAYFGVMESSESQATFGKMAMGIKVGDSQGNRISFGNAIGRYFGKILSSLLLLIGYLMVLWDGKRQALHDKLADTYVYRK
jgi:uncharacterized RDD family membrane protein YckC